MTPAEAHDGPETASLIRDVMQRARQATGSGTKLAARLRELGIGPDDGYSESAISNWINGRAMPPGDVLLTAAAIAGIPIGPNASLPESIGPAVEDWRATVEQLQDQLDELRTDVIHLYGQMGIPRPKTEHGQGQRKAQAG